MVKNPRVRFVVLVVPPARSLIMPLVPSFRSFVAAAALVATVAVPTVAQAKLTKVGGGTAGFHATGPAGLSIDGKTSEVDVADDGTNVTVTVKLGSIETGMGLRDRHTREDLDAEHFPTATLKVARGALKIPADGEVTADVKGLLTIHGVTKEITFHYTAKKNGDAIDVKSSVTITVADFGVKPRSYLGIGIKPNVDILASFSVKDAG